MKNLRNLNSICIGGVYADLVHRPAAEVRGDEPEEARQSPQQHSQFAHGP